MRRRRTLLALAIAAAVAALAATVAGRERATSPPGAEESKSLRGGPVAPPPPLRIELRAGRSPRRVVAPVGTHVIVRVDVPAPGEVDVEGLGLTDAATQEAPATFDVLLDRPGSYSVTFRPTEGRPRPAGELVVRPR